MTNSKLYLYLLNKKVFHKSYEPLKLFMNNKIVVFISGKGSNAKNIINYFSDNTDFKVSHVFSNNKHSDFINYIKNTNVQYFLFEEAEINGKVFKELKKINPRLIILAGFLKKIPPLYIKFFKNLKDEQYDIVHTHQPRSDFMFFILKSVNHEKLYFWES